MGPGFAPEEGGDGTGWDGASVVPAALFDDLAEQGDTVDPSAIADLYESYGVSALPALRGNLEWWKNSHYVTSAFRQSDSEDWWVIWDDDGPQIYFRNNLDGQATASLYERDEPESGDPFALFTFSLEDVWNDNCTSGYIDTYNPKRGYRLYVGDQTNLQVIYVTLWCIEGK